MLILGLLGLPLAFWIGRRWWDPDGDVPILHAGHVSYLRQARRKGDLLVVGLNSDASIRRIKASSSSLVPTGS